MKLNHDHSKTTICSIFELPISKQMEVNTIDMRRKWVSTVTLG